MLLNCYRLVAVGVVVIVVSFITRKNNQQGFVRGDSGDVHDSGPVLGV